MAVVFTFLFIVGVSLLRFSLLGFVWVLLCLLFWFQIMANDEGFFPAVLVLFGVGVGKKQ